MKTQLSLKKQRSERVNFSRRFVVHGDVLMITSRTEEGLPFPPNDLINFGILSPFRPLALRSSSLASGCYQKLATNIGRCFGEG